jgi:hypothetical protein
MTRKTIAILSTTCAIAFAAEAPAMAAQSGIAGSSVSGTWTEKPCLSGFAVGLQIRRQGSSVKSIAVMCKGGDIPTSEAQRGGSTIFWSNASPRQSTLVTSAAPGTVSPPFNTTDFVCPRNTYITGIGAGWIQSTNAIAGLHFSCAAYSQQRDGTWSAGSLSTVTTTGGTFGQLQVCGSNSPAKSVSIKLTGDVPTGVRLTCDNPTRGRQAPTAEDLIRDRKALIETPVLSPVANASYVSNGPVVFVLKANVPGATKWKVALSSPNGRVRAPMKETRDGRVIAGKFYVGPFDIDQRLRGNTVVYDFYACTNDNKCTRPNRGGFYACAKPARGEGCSAPGMISGGGGSGGGTTPPANTLSFARDLYPAITTGCAGCHGGNRLYPQKLQTNAGQCGVTSEPAIPFNTSMNAATMLNRLKCLKASSRDGAYTQALGKVYVVPSNYNASGLHWKAQNSPAFSQATKDLIRNWIAQGANP